MPCADKSIEFVPQRREIDDVLFKKTVAAGDRAEAPLRLLHAIDRRQKPVASMSDHIVLDDCAKTRRKNAERRPRLFLCRFALNLENRPQRFQRDSGALNLRMIT